MKPLDDLSQEEKALVEKIAEDQGIADDPNYSPSEREAA